VAVVTRFAPSPTGPLHLGHAYSACLAHDLARAAGGRFLVRIEDTDRARCRPEWEAAILDDLAWLGLVWDGPVLRQSEQAARYAAAIEQLAGRGLLYPCSCTRADIRAALSAPQEGVAFAVYPGTCRGRPMADRRPGDALRLDLGRALAGLGPVWFVDEGSEHPGRHAVDPAEALARIGDVVLWRRSDQAAAYFLASALDDAAQGITHVVRGADLFAFTPVQVILLRLLGLRVPVYHHHRLIRDEAGRRLAKRDAARAIAVLRAQGASPAEVRRIVGLAA
jgi:glutamyl-Q tRNA(Asp) synthetase